MELLQHLNQFADLIMAGKVEIYNEASIQYELAFFLRQMLPEYKIQLERNISYFNLDKQGFTKKEMDIVIFNREGEKHCIELKFPTNGQYPEQMFSACKDLQFLEELVTKGFSESYFVMFANDPLFYCNTGDSGIYLSFRKQKLLKGTILKPTGNNPQQINLRGTYKVNWKNIAKDLNYFVIAVNS